MEIIDKYMDEIKEDTKINVMNIQEVQMMAPAIKHKWVARLVHHKMEINKIKSLINKAKDDIIERETKNSITIISRPSLERFADNHDVVKRLKVKLEEEEFVVLYLEKVEQILKNLTFDIKNVVELMKLEQL